MEVLILASLARAPMHGYDIKTELRYKHVRWWAKAEHGHLYAALSRLEDKGQIEQVGESDKRGKKVYRITDAGRTALHDAVEQLCVAPDHTYFDIDLAISSLFAFDREQCLVWLEQRRQTLRSQLEEARALRRAVEGYIPTSGRLIIDHRIEHLEREINFADKTAETLRSEASWGSFLGNESIQDFVTRTGVPLETDSD